MTPTNAAILPAKKACFRKDLVLTKRADGSIIGDDGNTYTIGKDSEYKGILQQDFLIANNSGFGIIEWQALPTDVQNLFR